MTTDRNRIKSSKVGEKVQIIYSREKIAFIRPRTSLPPSSSFNTQSY